MAEIKFLDTDAESIMATLIAAFETYIGETLYYADERRIFLETFGYAIAAERSHINETAKQNLLRYATGEELDALGELYMNARLDADYARTNIKFTLSSAQNQDVIVPQGTRCTPDGKLFFATDEVIVFSSGETEKEMTCTATETGSDHNGFVAGQINKLVDGVPFVKSVSNTTTSSGGSSVETDEEYRERLRLAPFGFAVAGPANAYEFIAKSVSTEIGDVAVYSPSAGVVEIAVIMNNGVIPDAEDTIIDDILEACSAKDKRPLTDKVQVIPAVAKTINIDMDYYISNDDYSVLQPIQQAIDEYKLWQTSKIGRDINPDKLAELVYNAGAARVVIREPVYTKAANNGVAQIGTTNISFKGSVTE